MSKIPEIDESKFNFDFGESYFTFCKENKFVPQSTVSIRKYIFNELELKENIAGKKSIMKGFSKDLFSKDELMFVMYKLQKLRYSPSFKGDGDMRSFFQKTITAIRNEIAHVYEENVYLEEAVNLFQPNIEKKPLKLGIEDLKKNSNLNKETASIINSIVLEGNYPFTLKVNYTDIIDKENLTLTKEINIDFQNKSKKKDSIIKPIYDKLYCNLIAAYKKKKLSSDVMDPVLKKIVELKLNFDFEPTKQNNLYQYQRYRTPADVLKDLLYIQSNKMFELSIQISEQLLHFTQEELGDIAEKVLNHAPEVYAFQKAAEMLKTPVKERAHALASSLIADMVNVTEARRKNTLTK